jgi:hypothetical protein
MLNGIARLIKGKKAIEIEELCNKYLTQKELMKKTLYGICFLFLPIFSIYLFLIINGGTTLYNSKTPFFVFLIIVSLSSRIGSFFVNARFFAIAKERKSLEEK